jgi:hypothetical protein
VVVAVATADRAGGGTGGRLDLRLFVNKALPAFQLWKDDETESDCHDLITAAFAEHLVAVRQADERGSRAERKENERGILQEILLKHATRVERVREWTERTGKSERAFYRRLAEMQ